MGKQGRSGGIKIRAETAADIPAIYAVQKAAFRRIKESRLIDVLRAKGAFTPSMSLVAENNGVIVGHVLFTDLRLWSPDRELKAAALGPVGTHPHHQRQGIANRLIRAGLEHLKKQKYDAVVVLGNPMYYCRFGFDPRLAAVIKCSYSGPDFMALELRAGSLKKSGKLQAAYHKAFADAGV